VLVSYILFTYNHVAFIDAALQSALAQTYDPMEVVITDDGSTDGTAERIEAIIAQYRGPKTIRFRKNRFNAQGKGVVRGTVEDARGEIVVAADGDDESLPHRTAVIVGAFEADDQLQCISSNANVIDEAGTIQRLWHEGPVGERTLANFRVPSMGMLGATVAFRRAVFDVFGPLDHDVVMGDRVIPLRAAIVGRLGYIDEVLVNYRQHSQNMWLGFDSKAGGFERWRSQLARRNELMIPVLVNRIRDLETGLAAFPARSAQLDELLRSTQRFLQEALIERALYDRANLTHRLFLVAKGMPLKGPGFRERFRWAVKFLFPHVHYRRTLRMKRLQTTRAT